MNRVDSSMVTTSNELPGYRIVKNFGIVRGIIVRSRRDSRRCVRTALAARRAARGQRRGRDAL